MYEVVIHELDPRHAETKLDHLDDLFNELFGEEGRKVVLFSEWTTMLDLIEKMLEKRRLNFVRLDGSVPQKQRQELVEKFQTDPYWKDLILFYEYFHGDNGAGLGASHQTGWTGLVAKLIEIFGRDLRPSRRTSIAGGRQSSSVCEGRTTS